MKTPIPEGHYIKEITVNEKDIEVEFIPKKKVGLLFITLGFRYWPYLAQCLKDCQTHFLPHHKVDFFVWTDFSDEETAKLLKMWEELPNRYRLGTPNEKKEISSGVVADMVQVIRNYEVFNGTYVKSIVDMLQNQGVKFIKGPNAKILCEFTCSESTMVQLVTSATLLILKDSFAETKRVLSQAKVFETENREWPMPTLMRYHLFLQQEEELKDYDHLFYLDADMRVEQKIKDEILEGSLTAAPHPGYVVNEKWIPPYEPNKESAAYIHRLGYINKESGRLIPFYAAGGFQGGKTAEFIDAMKTMRERIDRDAGKNYTAIWNDESHWNHYLWNYQMAGGDINFLDVSYVMPDSLIKEYYEPMWGRSYEAKIRTLTKPFSLVPLESTNPDVEKCPTCGDSFTIPGIIRVVKCGGIGKSHEVEQRT